MAFKIGQKVVCIKQGSWEPCYDQVDPKYNKVYTIFSISENLGVAYLQLLGIDPLRFYDSIQFRPLDYDFVNEVMEMIEEESLVTINR